MTTTPQEPDRTEPGQGEDEVDDGAQTSEVSGLGSEQGGGADATDKSTGAAPDQAEQPE